MSRHAASSASLSDLRADIAALRADMAGLRSLIEKALQTTPARQWLSVEESAKLAEKTEQCVRGWCAVYRIGVQVKGRWQVDRAGLRRVVLDRLDGNESRLPPGLMSASRANRTWQDGGLT
jgi:hypothetical protein